MMAALNHSPENTVIYRIFPCFKTVQDACSVRTEDLEVLAENCVHKIRGFLDRYIWQSESFNLTVMPGMAESPPHLQGSTCFEDNIEDEWFIVFLLFYLSKHNSELIIQVQDDDGEFLLIEAADFIPKWLNNDTSVNRVFIYKGELHIIPVAQSPAEITPVPCGTPAILNALAAVHDFSSVTQASKPVQDAISHRIKDYPHKIEVYKHRALCFLPSAVASILKEDPKLLAPAVKAFYARDPLDVKACQAMKFFAPETRVMTEVTFTRCLYAQLMCQKYEPDQRTGWNLPPINSLDRKAHELGMKLACGFEILASNAKNMNIDGEAADHDFNNDVRWRRFAAKLKEKGYFRGEIDGSRLYQQLMLQAKDFYLSSLKKDTNSNINPGMRIRSLMESLSISYEELKEQENHLRPADDDSWIDVTPEKLDQMLNDLSHRPAQSELVQTITGELKSFMSHRSDIEGAEVPETNKRNKKQKINFDPEAFADAMNNILDFRIPGSDDDCSSSTMSGYTDDEDEDVVLTEERHGKKEGNESDFNVKDYMNQMDRELAETAIGLSFERLPPRAPTSSRESDSDINDEDEDFQPVDIDLTALKNILESYSSQQGLPGPASNLLSSLGIKLPDNSES